MMKNKLRLSILLLMFISNLNSFSQTLTERKLYKFLLSQDKTQIVNEIKSLGFIFYNNELINGIKSDVYIKPTKGEDIEIVAFSSNYEMFSIQYKPLNNYYYSYMEVLLTPKYKYSYSHNNTKYYDWKGLRVGINDNLKRISVIIALKKYLPKELTEEIIINSK